MGLLWIGGLQSVARWLELLAFGIYVYDLTKSPLLVTLVTLLKLAPLGLFGLVAGALPARIAPRSLYLAGIGLMLLTTGAGFFISWFGTLAVWQVLLISFLGGVFWVLDFPVRRKMIGDAVPVQRLAKAVGLDTLANNGTRMLGPALGGVLLQYAELEGVFALNFFLYAVCLVATMKLPLGRVSVKENIAFGLVDNIREGMSVVMQQPVLLATLMVTVTYNLFGFPLLSLVPVLGRDELHLSASIIGLLASMEGAGALLGGVLFLLLGRVRFYRKIYVLGVAGCFAFWLVCAFSSRAEVMGGALLVVGLGSACFAVMQTTLLILNSEARFRSQIFGILSLSIGTGLIGFAQVGLVASWFGPYRALILSATLGLCSLLWVCLRWPQIIAGQREHPVASTAPSSVAE